MYSVHICSILLCGQRALYLICFAKFTLYFLVVLHVWVYTVFEGCGTSALPLPQWFEPSSIIPSIFWRISMQDVP